ncbi:hypothetical protein KJ909_04275, partial [Patescibacteria group bacterium]|nr:hypothetical protein [Patescibacteria group bacterium]
MIIVLGPTASGKSAMALELAKKFNGFLISADSRQVFKKMNIGTNKDKGVWIKSKFFVDGIEECLINLVSPDEYYSLENWLRDLKSAINAHPNKLPIIAGETKLIKHSSMPSTKNLLFIQTPLSLLVPIFI